MKNIWTEEDIKSQQGIIIIRNDATKPLKDLGFARTVVFKIGFSHVGKKYGLCNILTDGWYHGVADSHKELADYLNADEKGYRPLTKEEFLQLVDDGKNQIFY